MVLVGAALKRPAPVAALIGAVVLLLSAPAIGAEDRAAQHRRSCRRTRPPARTRN